VFNPQSGSYWFFTSPRLKLIPELTVVFPLYSVSFSRFSARSQNPSGPLSRERLIILSHTSLLVNTFFETFFDFFQLFSFLNDLFTSLHFVPFFPDALLQSLQNRS